MIWLAGLMDHLRQGGWVMVPLVAVSLLLWTMVVDRFLLLRGLGRHDLSSADLGRALATDEEPTGNGLRTTLVRQLRAVRRGVPATDLALLHMLAEDMRRHYTGGLRLIEVLAAVAPLLGLLGTVLGMIRTFDVISVFGTGNPRALADGISLALITTQAGLLVAIPGLFAAGRLRRAAARHDVHLAEAVQILGRSVDEEMSP